MDFPTDMMGKRIKELERKEVCLKRMCEDWAEEVALAEIALEMVSRIGA